MRSTHWNRLICIKNVAQKESKSIRILTVNYCTLHESLSINNRQRPAKLLCVVFCSNNIIIGTCRELLPLVFPVPWGAVTDTVKYLHTQTHCNA